MPRDPELSPSEEQVRRLLADARHIEPMPDEVVARLDGVLTGLAAERRDVDHADRSAAIAADLAAARRRRTARNLLVAAAAVVAIGVGMNSVDLTVSGDDDGSAATSDSGGAAADAPPAAQAERDGGARHQIPEPQGSLEADKDGVTGSLAFAEPVRLSSDRFGAQVRRLHTSTRTITMADSVSPATDGLFSLSRSPLRAGCSTRGWGEGLLVPARYDGQLGAVIFRKATGETQVVDLFLCGNDEPTRSTTLPVR
ncbi:hypothetical protein [Nocardioides sp.]|uniref:hypothetical protein n=1 Tax=Nocardioides sp. TaxID=35761 RepID=UPI0025D027E9|nr:hypothetical protein [Nocardioides sp.]